MTRTHAAGAIAAALGALLLVAPTEATPGIGWGPTPAGAEGATVRCRCPQLPLARYWENADVVLVGTATAVRRVADASGVERLEVAFTPHFRQGRAFKGSLEGVVFATTTSSASCGLPVQVGETWVVLASLGDPAAPSRAWFDHCSGSRIYDDRPGAGGEEAFLGLPNRRVVPRLFELMAEAADGAPADPGAAPGGGAIPGAQSVPDFHTSPACWQEPRIVQLGTPAPELRGRVRVDRAALDPPDAEPILSPNRAYGVWADFRPGPEGAGPGGLATLLVDVERPALLRLAAVGAVGPPGVEWINETLLFTRIPWSPSQFTDVVLDVERGEPIYQTWVLYAREAFEQFREACLGQCPCLVVPGETRQHPTPPPSRGHPDDEGALDDRLTTLSFLNDAWDGRVFTTPGAGASTLSALGGRDEVPADVLAVEFVAGGWWLQVALYDVSTCVDPDAVPVHAGWVPAFTPGGVPVASSWPGGC